ncbi:methyl-accepting chemotaxis protein, partial [Arcobacter sp. HD9-500m-PIT-SAG02]
MEFSYHNPTAIEFGTGNLIAKINEKTESKSLLELKNILNNMASDLLYQSLNVGKTLEKSSDALIQNVNKLNISSNEAAASLEETSAVLEEITATVVNNSTNVIEMA